MSVSFTSARKNPGAPGVLDIDAAELRSKLDDVHLIDVREPSEFTGELGHIKGAELIPLQTVPKHCNRLRELTKTKPVVVICRSGGRSGKACEFLCQTGLGQIYNLKGGMLMWNELNFETEK